MSAITPDSYIKLVRFDVTKENQLTFSDGVAQVNFFLNTLQGVEMQASSYQRKDYKVRFEASIDSIDIYNYMIVRNTSYNYKYYFYYITDMTYINDEMTEITIKLDVFQTFQFEYSYKKSFVEREHVQDDTVGKNIVDEGIETGDYIINNQNHWNIFNPKIFLVQVAKDLSGNLIAGTRLGNLFISGGIYACGSLANVVGLIEEYTADEDLKIESIKNIYQIPWQYTNLPDILVVQPRRRLALLPS